MTKITKTDGTVEEFSEEKIRKSITKAFIDAGRDPGSKKQAIDQLARKITDAVAKGGVRTAKQIRDMALHELDTIEAAASKAWREFDAKYKK